jgi:hypothetical protein
MQSSRSIACLLARFDTPRLKALLEERADGATLIDSLLNKLKDFTDRPILKTAARMMAKVTFLR